MTFATTSLAARVAAIAARLAPGSHVVREGRTVRVVGIAPAEGGAVLLLAHMLA